VSKFWLPTQKGIELFPEVTRIPARVRVLFDGADVGPDAADEFVSRYYGPLSRFHFAQAQNYSLSTIQSQRQVAEIAPGVFATYNNQLGVEYLTLNVTTAASPVRAAPQSAPVFDPTEDDGSFIAVWLKELQVIYATVGLNSIIATDNITLSLPSGWVPPVTVRQLAPNVLVVRNVLMADRACAGPDEYPVDFGFANSVLSGPIEESAPIAAALYCGPIFASSDQSPYTLSMSVRASLTNTTYGVVSNDAIAITKSGEEIIFGLNFVGLIDSLEDVTDRNATVCTSGQRDMSSVIPPELGVPANGGPIRNVGIPTHPWILYPRLAFSGASGRPAGGSFIEITYVFSKRIEVLTTTELAGGAGRDPREAAVYQQLPLASAKARRVLLSRGLSTELFPVDLI
jgi:hypothetical protein